MKKDIGRRKLRFSLFVILPGIYILWFTRQKSLLLLLFAAAIHESGHFFAARLLGLPFSLFRLSVRGAVLRTRGQRFSYGAEILLCAAGPAANLIFGAVWQLFFGGIFVRMNLFLALLNLLPVPGLDGGRILFCGISYAAGPGTAQKVITVLSFFSVIFLWLLSVFFLIRYGMTLSLLLFCCSIFIKVFLSPSGT